jgi:hypothetical protein
MINLVEGKVYDRPAGTGHQHVVPMTYLYCGAHEYDPVTGDELKEREYLFIVWQGTAMRFRSRLVASDIEQYKLVESKKGLTPPQMSNLARGAFRDWECLEYVRMGVLAP